MMSSYPCLCTHPLTPTPLPQGERGRGEGGCCRPAVYKIAARWSDGTTEELKTYALCCAECLPQAYGDSRAKQAACRTARGETLEIPGVYLLAHGRRDQELQPRPDLEEAAKHEPAGTTPLHPPTPASR